MHYNYKSYVSAISIDPSQEYYTCVYLEDHHFYYSAEMLLFRATQSKVHAQICRLVYV